MLGARWLKKFVFFRHSGGPSVSENHPLSKLQGQALGHLSKDHIKYFFHWTALLKMEEKFQTNSSPLQALWTESAEKRLSIVK